MRRPHRSNHNSLVHVNNPTYNHQSLLDIAETSSFVADNITTILAASHIRVKLVLRCKILVPL